jgi:uncharacterized protein YkwD
MLQLKRAPAPAQPRAVAVTDGFQLSVLSQQPANQTAADYQLSVTPVANGGLDVSISVKSAGLAACELELSYPTAYTPQGGQALPWPDDSGMLAYNVEMDDPGRLVYTARLRDEAAQRGSRGQFEVVRLVFAEAQAPVAQPVLTPAPVAQAPLVQPAPAVQPAAVPGGTAAQQWLRESYLALPALNGPYSVYGDANWQQAADEVYRLANEARAKKGQPALLRDPHLDAVAQAHALDMARQKYFEHKNLLGMEVFERLTAAGAPGWWTAGENIAAGQRTPEEVHTSWMNSSGHKVNIRSEKYQRMGVGVYYDASSPYGWYWVQVFASYDEPGTGTTWVEPGV